MDLSILQRKFKLRYSKADQHYWHIRELNALYPEGYTIPEICDYLRQCEGLGGKSLNRSSKGTVANSILRLLKPAMGADYKFSIENKYIVQETFKEFTDHIRRTSTVDLSMIPSEEEMHQLIRETNPRTSALISFLYVTPLRVANLCDLKLSQIHKVTGDEPYYLISTVQKGDRDHKPISSLKVVDFVKEVYRSKVHLFETRNGTPYYPANIHRTIRAAGKEVLGRKMWPHLFRHIFATHMAQKGVNPIYIARQLGHDLRTLTQTYQHSYIDPAILSGIITNKMPA
ncbi:MAG: hypothetical protein CMF59_16785 [Leptospiraceae bacterium]|nr:hypothetical protein [Leptospiraceae bacterium]